MAGNNKFGFTISGGRQIDYNKNLRVIADYIYEREPSLRQCMECGGCSATCSTGSFTPFSPREVFILIKRGETLGLSKKLKTCMLCGKCTLVCPRGVNTRNVITLAKEAFQKYIEYAV
jgi:heterodisulfide reductase subunit C